MKRRTMMLGLGALPLLGKMTKAQVPAPYRVSLIDGGFDGAQWHAGVAVALDEGWKTYWRMPGEAGIPPQFDWAKSQGAASIEVLYPVPGRLHDLSGEAVGYIHRVVFPVVVKPAANPAQAKLRLDLFIAVCKEVCIPANAHAALDLVPGSASSAASALIDEWVRRVPIAGSPVHSATVTMDGEKPMLLIKLRQRVEDIFVETEGPAYFRAPVFSQDGLEVRLIVDNLKDAAGIKGATLKLTLTSGGSGIEQSVAVN